MIKLTAQQISSYEEQKSHFMIQDPWNDSFCKKIGLTEMYVQDTIAETVGVSAEQNPKKYINKPSTKYEKLHNLIQSFAKESSIGNFNNLKVFCEETTDSKIELNIWESYIPDIRLLDNIGEILSWMHIKYAVSPEDNGQ